MRVPRPTAALILAAAAAACSPALDWRESRPEGSGVTLLVPCRPFAQARDVTLAGRRVRLALHACTAAETTWAIAFADIGDPALVAPALDALRLAAAANVAAAEGRGLPLAVSGATPNAASQRLAFSGRLPDGREVQEQVAVFTRGTLVFQATVIGSGVPAEGADAFFASIRFAT